jgi:hypothetical protein
MSQNDGPINFEHIAEGSYIICPGRKIPTIRSSRITATIATMIEVNHLCDVRQLRKTDLEFGMIEAGTSMKQE